jgi:hypothetical protein
MVGGGDNRGGMMMGGGGMGMGASGGMMGGGGVGHGGSSDGVPSAAPLNDAIKNLKYKYVELQDSHKKDLLVSFFT